MTEIKFRGLSIHGGRVYGYYAHTSRFSNNNDHYKHVIITQSGENREIEPDTVGQYTGRQDRDGFDVYDGDIIGDGYLFVVYWDKTMMQWHAKRVGGVDHEHYPLTGFLQTGSMKGNKRQNPKLLIS